MRCRLSAEITELRILTLFCHAFAFIIIELAHDVITNILLTVCSFVDVGCQYSLTNIADR